MCKSGMFRLMFVSHTVAYGWLSDYQDELFGGGRFEGDRRRKLPAAWWRRAEKPADAQPPEVRRELRVTEVMELRQIRRGG
jgi:hypothetical protein